MTVETITNELTTTVVDTDRAVIRVLLDGRATPKYIHDQSDVRHKPDIHDSLNKLAEAGLVENIDRGLWGLTDAARALVDERDETHREIESSLQAAENALSEDTPSVERAWFEINRALEVLNDE
jgi:restriction endonuclease Mrr